MQGWREPEDARIEPELEQCSHLLLPQRAFAWVVSIRVPVQNIALLMTLQ